MKVSRGASHSLKQAQAQTDAKNLKSNKNQKSAGLAKGMMDSAQVSLSQRAQQINKATNIAKDSKVDEKKIAYFQNLIDGGKYNVDSAKVADKLVDDHLKMPT